MAVRNTSKFDKSIKLFENKRYDKIIKNNILYHNKGQVKENSWLLIPKIKFDRTFNSLVLSFRNKM